MNNFLIIKDNKVVNKVRGNSTSLNSGESFLEATGSNSNVSPHDYYLPASNTFYSAINPQFTYAPYGVFTPSDPSGSLVGDFTGVINNTPIGVTCSYSENITPVPTISDIISDDFIISDFSSDNSSFSFQAQATDATITLAPDTVTLKVSVEGVTDTNSNPVWAYGDTKAVPFRAFYTGSV